MNKAYNARMEQLTRNIEVLLSNTLGLACTLLCLEILYLNRMRWSKGPVAIIAAITLAVDRLSESRTAELIVVLAPTQIGRASCRERV